VPHFWLLHCQKWGFWRRCKSLVSLRIFAQDTCLTCRSALCSKPTWGSASAKSMQRFTARFLLLIALVGTLLPLALQAKAAPSHACCRRTGAHHCSDSASPHSGGAVLRDAGCCNHDCCRAVASSQYAHPQPAVGASGRQAGIANPIASRTVPALSGALFLLHSRAPPTQFLA